MRLKSNINHKTNNPPRTIKKCKTKIKSKNKYNNDINILQTIGDKTNKTPSSENKFLSKYSNQEILPNNIITIQNPNQEIKGLSCQYNKMNTLIYEKALMIDKTTYCHFYQSLLRRKQLLIFIFHTKDDYNSRIIKISLFLFSFSLNYTVNAFFFTYSTMHKIFIDHRKFNFIYLLPQIFFLL